MMNNHKIYLVTFFSLLFLVNVSLLEAKPSKAAIASAHPLATQAGHEVLAAGGNAFDAAIAIAATLAVVEPYSSGIGGGGFFLLHRAEDGFEVMLDARETAPFSASSDMYLDKNGEAVPALSREGPLSAGIPGLPAALDVLASRYGRKPLNESMAPAIRYAREGFAVGQIYAKMVAWRENLLKRYPAAAKQFLFEGEVPQPGYKLVQTDLAKTLSLIADYGARGFYAGDLADRLVEGVRAAGGNWQKRDLAEYKVIDREPVRGEYRGMKVTSVALPSSGGIVLINTLNILANFGDLNVLKESARAHLIAEALRRSYRDRAEYMGDPDFVKVPTERLLHPFYAAGQSAGIRLDKATPSNFLAGAAVDSAGTDTTHFSVIDKDGNRVAATLSVNFPFGSGFVVSGTGVVLNNEMDDFAAKAGVPNGYGLVAGKNNSNAISPGKRMLSSMTPTFLETKDRLAVIGTPGGSRIITMVLLGALEFHRGANAKSIVSMPRFHHQFLPDQIYFEPEAFIQNTRLELQMRGHFLQPSSRQYGNMHVVVFNKNRNKLTAASDPRGEGSAEVH